MDGCDGIMQGEKTDEDRSDGSDQEIHEVVDAGGESADLLPQHMVSPDYLNVYLFSPLFP